MFALLLASCTCNCYQQPQVPQGDVDPEKPPEGVDAEAYAKADGAGQACMILRHLGCPEGSPEGMQCDESIRDLVNIGTFEKQNVLCIRTSRTVERVRTCDVECPQ